MDKRKIGIVTFFTNMNYGSVLQAFALKSFLENKGYDAYVIDYTDMSNPINVKMKRKTYFNRLISGIKNPSVIPEMLKGKWVSSNSTNREKNVETLFSNFNRNYLNLYKGNYSNFDYFITGSDQVWKLTVPGLHEIFFLRFTEESKRISYAASLGVTEIPKYNRKRFGEYLKQFKAISVREDNAKDIIEKEYGLKVTQVLDPVLLVGKDFWKTQFEIVDSGNIGSYIFCYFLDDYTSVVNKINELAQKLSCRVLIVNSDVKIPDSMIKEAIIVQPSPLEFVRLLYQSKAVITDSFHGTAFSVLFHKVFWTIPRNYLVYEGQKSRLESLLRLVNLSDRYISDKNMTFELKINTDKIDDLLEIKRQSSVDYLYESLVER